MTTPKLLLAAALAATGGLAAHAYAGDESSGSCCEAGPSGAMAAQFVSTAAPEAPAGEVAETRSVDAILDDLRAAETFEEKRPFLRELVDSHPDDERAPAALFNLATGATDDATKEELTRELADKYGDDQYGVMAKGWLQQRERVGQPFELTFEEIRTGERISLQDDLQGKVVVIDFWATWCGPCIAEMPKMKDLYSQYKDRGVEFIGISLDQPPSEGGRDKLLAYLQENGIDWPQYYQGSGWESEFSKGWGVSSIPQLFIIDAEGKLHSTEARGQLETLIPELVAQRDGAADEGAEMEAGAEVEDVAAGRM